MTPEEVIIRTQEILKENKKDWQKRYFNYMAKAVSNTPLVLQKRQLFHKWGNLNVYCPLGNVIDNKNWFDLRYLGQSVGYICVNEGVVSLHISEDQYKNNCNEKYFIGYPKDICRPTNRQKGDETGVGYLWQSSVEAKEFRKYFKSKPEKHGHVEHRFENNLLNEFWKRYSDKSLCGIQPVTIGESDLFFQLPTPLKASTTEIAYANRKGGGIDILARRNNVLTVFELKDEYKSSEGPEKVICQAVAYATFIVELCNTEARDIFWEFCGFHGKTHGNETINVSILMPDPGDGSQPCFTNKILSVPGSDMKLKLHTTYFDKDNMIITWSSL